MISEAAAPAVDRRVLAADLAVKAATIGLLLFALTHQDWERFSDKSMGGRAIVYPLALGLVPLVWWVAHRRGARAAYPALADLLFSIPWLIDVVGNAANAFDQISWFDDAAHFVNWGFLSAALAVALPLRLGVAARIGLCTGLGCVAALGWEIGEYYTFVRGGAEEATAYTDTLGDMSLGTTGAFLAAVFVTSLRR